MIIFLIGLVLFLIARHAYSLWKHLTKVSYQGHYEVAHGKRKYTNRVEFGSHGTTVKFIRLPEWNNWFELSITMHNLQNDKAQMHTLFSLYNGWFSRKGIKIKWMYLEGGRVEIWAEVKHHKGLAVTQFLKTFTLNNPNDCCKFDLDVCAASGGYMVLVDGVMSTIVLDDVKTTNWRRFVPPKLEFKNEKSSRRIEIWERANN
jgi:hypothetical protein